MITEDPSGISAARWSLATGSTRPGWPSALQDSCFTEHPLAWDAAVDAVADLNADMSEDADWTVSRHGA